LFLSDDDLSDLVLNDSVGAFQLLGLLAIGWARITRFAHGDDSPFMFGPRSGAGRRRRTLSAPCRPGGRPPPEPWVSHPAKPRVAAAVPRLSATLGPATSVGRPDIRRGDSSGCLRERMRPEIPLFPVDEPSVNLSSGFP